MEENTNTTYKFNQLCPYVREIGLQRGDEWRNRERKIYDHQFMFCFIGIAYIIIKDKKYTLIPGSLVLIPPNTPHSFWFASDKSELYYMHFDYFYRDDYEKVIEQYSMDQKYIRLFGREINMELTRNVPVFENNYIFPEFLQVKDLEKMETIFRRLYKAFIEKECYGICTKTICLELLANILNQTLPHTSNYISSRQRGMVEEMKSYIASNYYRKLGASEIATCTDLCVDHASRLFKRYTGMKTLEYIAKFRIAKAKELMLEPDLSMQQISYMVGFSNENYFSQTVKKYEGQLPVALRRTLKGELDI